MSETIKFGDSSDLHKVGDAECGEGWCGSSYPMPCKCGGLIHANFGDEDYDGYWLYKMCDKCGDVTKKPDRRHIDSLRRDENC